MTAAAATRILGIGSPLGEDRIGWEAVHHLRAAGLEGRFPGLTLATCDRPGPLLLAAMAGAERVILVDAVVDGGPPGELIRLEGEGIDAFRQGLLSSHGFGLAEALELGRALGELPPRLLLYGITIGDPACRSPLPAVPPWLPDALTRLTTRIEGELAAG